MMLMLDNLKKEKLKQAYIRKHNSELEQQAILLMITDGET